MKRSFSQASPPPFPSSPLAQDSSPPTKKSKKKSKASKLKQSINASSPASSHPRPDEYASPRAGKGRDSRSRSRSVSVGPGAPGGSKTTGEDADGQPGAGGADDDEPVEEEEALLFSDDEFGMNQKESARQKEDLRVLLQHFDEDQMDRYEAYRRSGLNKAIVRRLVNSVLQQSVSAPILTVVRGFAKVFVGQVVEKARSVANHEGPLTPEDIRQGYRMYLAEQDRVIATPGKKKLFVR